MMNIIKKVATTLTVASIITFTGCSDKKENNGLETKVEAMNTFKCEKDGEIATITYNSKTWDMEVVKNDGVKLKISEKLKAHPENKGEMIVEKKGKSFRLGASRIKDGDKETVWVHEINNGVLYILVPTKTFFCEENISK